MLELVDVSDWIAAACGHYRECIATARKEPTVIHDVDHRGTADGVTIAPIINYDGFGRDQLGTFSNVRRFNNIY